MATVRPRRAAAAKTRGCHNWLDCEVPDGGTRTGCSDMKATLPGWCLGRTRRGALARMGHRASRGAGHGRLGVMAPESEPRDVTSGAHFPPESQLLAEKNSCRLQTTRHLNPWWPWRRTEGGGETGGLAGAARGEGGATKPANHVTPARDSPPPALPWAPSVLSRRCDDETAGGLGSWRCFTSLTVS